MEQIFTNYLNNKKAENNKEPSVKTPKIDVNNNDYDSIVKLVDAANGPGAEAEPIITKNKKKYI